jgi:glyoxylase-like metal-dependent hydrolase (beta-lactamase superfamily II)
MKEYNFFESDFLELYVVRTKCLNYINYCYFVIDKETRQTLIIDPSWEFQKFERLAEENGEGVSLVLLTHSHYDHTNLSNDMYIRYKPKIYMSSNEMVQYGFRGLGVECVDDGQVINFGNRKIKCILTPGHTEGSMCYLLDDFVFTGDTVFIEGCGVCDLTGSDPQKMFDSIQKLKKIIHSSAYIFPGHAFGRESGVKFMEVCKINLYFNIEDKQKFVDFRMRSQQKRINFV